MVRTSVSMSGLHASLMAFIYIYIHHEIVINESIFFIWCHYIFQILYLADLKIMWLKEGTGTCNVPSSLAALFQIDFNRFSFLFPVVGN